MSDNYAAYRARTRFANLDGLRFICIAMVLWHHAQPVSGDLSPALSRGFLGVDFFFVLSGYLITTLLLREADRFGHFNLKHFYIRRLIRIVPVYFFVVGAVSFYYVVIKGETELAALIPYYVLFLSNFLTEHIPTLEMTWSLAVEEQYYLLWPLLLLVVPLRLLIPFALVLVALNVALAPLDLGYAPQTEAPVRIALPYATYAPILMGSLLAIALHLGRSFDLIDRLLGWRGAALAGFLVLGLTMHLAPADVRGLPNFVIHSVMTAILAALVLRERGDFMATLRQPRIARVGAVSYGIYLYHLIALDITQRVLDRVGLAEAWLILFAYSALAIAIAEVSFRTLEAYFRRFRPKPPPAPAARPIGEGR